MSQWKRQLLFAVLVVSGFGLAACHGSSSYGTASNGTSASGSSFRGSSSDGAARGLITLATGDLKLELLDPSRATAAGQTVLMTTLPNEQQFVELARSLTASRVVGLVIGKHGTDGNVFSVPTGASNATAPTHHLVPGRNAHGRQILGCRSVWTSAITGEKAP